MQAINVITLLTFPLALPAFAQAIVLAWRFWRSYKLSTRSAQNQQQGSQSDFAEKKYSG